MDSPLGAGLSPSYWDVPASPGSESQLDGYQALLLQLFDYPIKFQSAVNPASLVNGETDCTGSQAATHHDAVEGVAKEVANRFASESVIEFLNGATTEYRAGPTNNGSRDLDSPGLHALKGGEEQVSDEVTKKSTHEFQYESTQEPPNRALKAGTNGCNTGPQVTTLTPSVIIPSEWHRQRPGARGLRNPDNRCYRNSVLQALFHIPKLVNWMEGAHLVKCKPECVLCTLRVLCAQYWGQPGRYLFDTESGMKDFEGRLRFTRTFKGNEWIFAEQNDAYLFLLILLAAMRETNPSLSDIMNSLLGHTTITKKTCSHCNHETTRNSLHEQELILSVSWDAEISLDQILRDREFSHVYNDLKCDACDANRRHPYQKWLDKSPDVLIIHLKRFEPKNKAGTTFRKKTDRILLTESLDLTTLTTVGTPLFYRLQAVVHHRGSLNFGHYIADAKGPHGLWERMDDTNVSPSTVEKALDPSPQRRKDGYAFQDPWTPYLLFYVRCEDRRHLEKEPECKPSMQAEKTNGVGNHKLNAGTQEMRGGRVSNPPWKGSKGKRNRGRRKRKRH